MSDPARARAGGRPFVSVLVPVFNGARTLRRCVDAVLRQSYPAERLEILLIDGGSNDGSDSLASDYASANPIIRSLKNPARTIPSGLNLGLGSARGDIIVRVDSGTVIEEDYVEDCVETLIRSGASNVGGRMNPVGTSLITRAVALALTSKFGMGPGRFHYAKQEQPADTVYLGAFWRREIEALGGWDVSMHHSEDDELNLRLTKAGRLVLLNPDLRAKYFCRRSLGGLATQYFQYGRSKVRVLMKHGRLAGGRYFVPVGFSAYLVAFGLLVAYAPSGPQALVASVPALAYGLCAGTVAMRALCRTADSAALVLPIVFPVIHASYGFGFAAECAVGATRWLLRRLGVRDLPTAAETSRSRQ